MNNKPIPAHLRVLKDSAFSHIFKSPLANEKEEEEEYEKERYIITVSTVPQAEASGLMIRLLLDKTFQFK